MGSILVLSLILAACGKDEASKAAAISVAPNSAKGSEPSLAAAISDAYTPLVATASVPVSESELKDEAESIMARYPGKTAVELLNVPEVNEKLRTALQKLGQDKALQARIQSSVELAGQIKGLEGAARLDLDLAKYDQSRTTRMLQAVISEDPKQIVAFLVGEIEEAAPDISYGGLERAPNGVAILPDPAKKTLPAKVDLPD